MIKAEFSLFIYKNNMDLSKIGKHSYFIGSFPFDKSLTPENFEQKIKTYLTFQ